MRRALNLVKKRKPRNKEDNQETKRKDTEDPDIDISIDKIRRRIREEKEAAKGMTQDEKEAEVGGAQENSRLDESTDLDLTISY